MKGDATSVKHPTITIPPRMTYSSKSIMRHLKLPYEICWVDSSGLDKCYDEGNLHLLDHKLQVDQCFLLHPSLKDRNCLFIEKQYLTWHLISFVYFVLVYFVYNIKRLLFPNCFCSQHNCSVTYSKNYRNIAAGKDGHTSSCTSFNKVGPFSILHIIVIFQVK